MLSTVSFSFSSGRRTLVFKCQGIVSFFQYSGGLSSGGLVLRFSLDALVGLLLGVLEHGLVLFRLLLFLLELPSLLLALRNGDSLVLSVVFDLL